MQNDTVVIEEHTGLHMYRRKRYIDEHAGRKATSGHVNTYIEVDSISNHGSEIGDREVWKRSKKLNATAGCISGGTLED